MKALRKYLSRFEALEKTSEMQSPAWNVCWRNLQVPVRPKPAVDVHRLELTKKRDQNQFSHSNQTHSDHHDHHPHQQLIFHLWRLTALLLEVALSPGSVNGAHVIWLFPNQGKLFSTE